MIKRSELNRAVDSLQNTNTHVTPSNKVRPKRSIYLGFPKRSVHTQTQMNPSSSSPQSKATGLTKIFSPATLSILDMSPSVACTMDRCQTHFT